MLPPEPPQPPYAAMLQQMIQQVLLARQMGQLGGLPSGPQMPMPPGIMGQIMGQLGAGGGPPPLPRPTPLMHPMWQPPPTGPNLIAGHGFPPGIFGGPRPIPFHPRLPPWIGQGHQLPVRFPRPPFHISPDSVDSWPGTLY